MTAATTFVRAINDYIINPIIGLLFAAAMVLFIWGGAQMIFYPGTEDKREDGKRHLFWGIIGMFIMVSVYGLLNLITSTFGLPHVVSH